MQIVGRYCSETEDSQHISNARCRLNIAKSAAQLWPYEFVTGLLRTSLAASASKLILAFFLVLTLATSTAVSSCQPRESKHEPERLLLPAMAIPRAFSSITSRRLTLFVVQTRG